MCLAQFITLDPPVNHCIRVSYKANHTIMGPLFHFIPPRVGHGYGKTCRFSKTGSAGTGTGMDFGNPRHTATCTRGITGIHGYITTRCASFFSYFKSCFSHFFSRSLSCHTVMQPNLAAVRPRTLFKLLSALSHHPTYCHSIQVIKKASKLLFCIFKTNQWFIYRLRIQVLKVSKPTIMCILTCI